MIIVCECDCLVENRREALGMEKGLLDRLETAVRRLEVIASGSQLLVSDRDLADDRLLDPDIKAFDEFLDSSLRRVVTAAEKIGGQVLDVTKILEQAYLVEKELLIKVKNTQKPNLEALAEFLKPLNDLIAKANAMAEGRRSDFFNHLKSAADSLCALVWIAFLGKDCGMSFPIAHVEESWQMAEFYNNKILVAYRNKDSDHVEWAKALKELYLPGLRDYVKRFYPLGPVWGCSGNTSVSVPGSSSVVKAISAKVPAAPPAKAHAAPPSKAPAAPLPPAFSLFSSVTTPRPKLGMTAVFEEINSSESVTSGLRKVTNDMKTKNQPSRAGIVSSTEKETRTNPSFSFKTGPPKFELQLGRKWAVENQTGKKDLIIDECDAKQSVYVYGCRDCVLQVKGKVNNITIDKCNKTGVLFKDVVAACEIVNCNGIEVQCEGSAPTLSIDNTGGCQVYLSKESLGCSITTAKSSEINMMVPRAGSQMDWLGMVDPVKASPPHVILLAFPFGTHAAPLHSLARALAGAAPSAIFSFVSTAKSLESLPKASAENLRLRPFEEEITADRSAAGGIDEIGSFFDASTEKIRAAVKVAEQDAGNVPVSCVMSDAFVWMADLVAEELGLPWVTVFLGFPLAMSALIHAEDLRARFGTSGRVMESHADTQLDFIPGLSAMRVRDLPEGIVFGDTSSKFALNLDAMVRRLSRAAAVIFPTLPGLEPVDAALNLILPVGPLNLLSPQPFVPDREGCLPWLNGHAASSVIYIAFGSVATLAPNELAELAHGLEASGVPFLWSLGERARSSLPEGFAERTRQKGKLVDWAPQVAVLSHTAVGFFVSHCGWNSTLESISAGVVMLCRPCFAEQRMVARAVESVLGVGADLGAAGIARETLVATLSAVLKGDDGKRMRERAAELRERTREAVLVPGGSFAKNFQILVELVCRK